MKWFLVVLGIAADAAQPTAVSAQPSVVVCGAAGDHSFLVADARALLEAQRVSVYILESSECLSNGTVASQSCRGLVIMEFPAELVRSTDGGNGDGGIVNAAAAHAVIRGSDFWGNRCERRLAETGPTGSVVVSSVTSEGFDVRWSFVLADGQTSFGQVPIRWKPASP